MRAVLVTTINLVVILALVLWTSRNTRRMRVVRAERHRLDEVWRRRYRIAALERELGIGQDEQDPEIAAGRRAWPLEPPAVDWQPR